MGFGFGLRAIDNLWKSLIKMAKSLKIKSSFLLGRFLTNEISAKKMGFGFGLRATDNLWESSIRTAKTLKMKKLISDWPVPDQ